MVHDLAVPRRPFSLLTDHLSNVIKFTSFTSKVRVEGTALGAVAVTTATQHCVLFERILLSCKLTTLREARAHSSGIWQNHETVGNYINAFELYSKRGEQMKRPLLLRGWSPL